MSEQDREREQTLDEWWSSVIKRAFEQRHSEAYIAWHDMQAATAAAVPPGHVVVPELVRDFVQEFADEPCAYKDSCPSTARHYRCVHCRARDALAAAEQGGERT